MGFGFGRGKQTMVSADEALPGRATRPYEVPERHATLPNGMRIVAVRPGEVLAQLAHSRKPVALPMAIDALPASADEQSYAGAPAGGGPGAGIPGIPSLPRY